MRVGFSSGNLMSCQPLSFGSGANPKEKPDTNQKPLPELDSKNNQKFFRTKNTWLTKKKN